MSSDDSDKTVFRQPGVEGDRTVIKPMPGGRGSAAPPTPPPLQPMQQPIGQQPVQQAVSQPVPPPPPVVDVESAYFRTSNGLNPLVNAASTLIAVFSKTRHSMSHPDVGGLHQRLINEIKTFETRAKEQNIKSETVLAARYALCAAIDEAVLNTPWGAESGWTQRTMLSVFHNETSGGEKFFLILDRMRETPAENLYFLELMYICLSLGFEGKYRVIHRGHDALEQIRDELFRIIRNHRGEYERSLSPCWQGLGKIRNSLAEYVPMWVIASIVGAVLFLSYSGFSYWLYDSSAPVVEQLTEISEMIAVAKK